VIVAAAFCPHPPLLVPALAAGAAGELDALRAACGEAVRRLSGAGARRLAVLGSGPSGRLYPGGRGTLAGYGVPVEVTLGDGSGPDLPLPLTLGAWLLAGVALPAVGVVAGPDGAAPLPGEYHREPAGLLVMGDGSARRADTSPGYADPRAVPYDAAVAGALRSGDPTGLAALDVALGAELLAAGACAWAAAGTLLAGGRYDADLLHDAAPYGVGYLVASWVRR
jgi:hypothetical protein